MRIHPVPLLGWLLSHSKGQRGGSGWRSAGREGSDRCAAVRFLGRNRGQPESPEVPGQESGCEVAPTVAAWEEEETSRRGSCFGTLRLLWGVGIV